MMDDKFIGIPFEHNGRDFESIDCIGLAWLYLKEQGIDFDIKDDKRIVKKWYLEDARRLLKGVEERTNSIIYQDRKPNDIVLFEFEGIVSHIGVLVTKNKFLHIFENRKSGISDITKWKNKLVGIYRVGDN